MIRPARPALAVLAAGALTLSLAAPAAAVEDEELYPLDSCSPLALGDPGFTDIADSPAPFAIACLAEYGIARGTSATTFGPNESVTRRQMATFLYRLGSVVGVRWNTAPTTAFADAGLVSGEQADAVTALTNAGIAQGRDVEGQRVFDPNGVVNRGQMAAFLNRFQQLVASTEDGFITPVDDTGEAPEEITFSDDGGVFQDDIRAIAFAEITQGVGDGTAFAPGRPVTRVQMARFLARTLAYEHLFFGLLQGYPVPPSRAGDEQAVAAPKAVTTVATSGATTTYTFSELPSPSYRITLFQADKISRLIGLHFFSYPSSNVDGEAGPADEGSVAATVTTANGAPYVAGTALSPTDGTITVVVTGGGRDEAVTPVLHRGGPTAAVDLSGVDDDVDEETQVLDAIVVGGTTVFAAPVLADGASFTGVPGLVDLPSDTVAVRSETGVQQRVTYDANDSFSVDGEAATLEDFEATLLGLRLLDDSESDPGPSSLTVTGFATAISGTSTFTLVVPDGPGLRKDAEELRTKAAAGAKG